jgi:hypothetical protein
LNNSNAGKLPKLILNSHRTRLGRFWYVSRSYPSGGGRYPPSVTEKFAAQCSSESAVWSFEPLPRVLNRLIPILDAFLFSRAVRIASGLEEKYIMPCFFDGPLQQNLGGSVIVQDVKLPLGSKQQLKTPCSTMNKTNTLVFCALKGFEKTFA